MSPIAKTGIIVAGVAALAALTVGATTLDGCHGNLFLLIAGDDTKYAATYSYDVFARVRIGQTKTEVDTLLGRPLDVVAIPASNLETWHYTISPSSRHYRIRAVVFENERVVDKIARLYVD